MTAWLLDVFVPGRPAPQGSKHARPIFRGRGDAKEFTGKVAQVESSKSGVREWRADVRSAVLDAWDQPPIDGPVVIELAFVLPRPKSLPKTKPTPRATKRPDWDKLSRATCDALTSAGVYHDDAQTDDAHVTKRIAELGETTGCRIRIGTARDSAAVSRPDTASPAPDTSGGPNGAVADRQPAKRRATTGEPT